MEQLPRACRGAIFRGRLKLIRLASAGKKGRVRLSEDERNDKIKSQVERKQKSANGSWNNGRRLGKSAVKIFDWHKKAHVMWASSCFIVLMWMPATIHGRLSSCDFYYFCCTFLSTLKGFDSFESDLPYSRKVNSIVQKPICPEKVRHFVAYKKSVSLRLVDESKNRL
ncbi:MAG: hypothetical protein HOP23_03580 [Methylococcaceae bacterium]|nr:hypothetical protein [Methylococcaceae bacterium]